MLLSKTADSISDGDLVDRQIRSRQNWSLLPTQVYNILIIVNTLVLYHKPIYKLLCSLYRSVCVRLQAIYASVLPGELMRGYMSHFPTFPSWLGKNSSTTKHSRIVQELASHMGLK